MPTIIKNVPRLIGSLLVWNAVLYVVGTIIMTTLAALSGLDWAAAAPQTKLMVSLGVVGAVCLNLRSYLDTTVSRLAKGELPLVDVPNSLPSNPPFLGSATETKTVTAQIETTKITTPAAQ